MKCTSTSLRHSSSIRTTMADLCKTDLQRIIKYLDDAAALYDKQHGAIHAVHGVLDNSPKN